MSSVSSQQAPEKHAHENESASSLHLGQRIAIAILLACTLAPSFAAKPAAQTISPYFNNYRLQAIAQTGHRREALAWMRAYWGGMLDEGATSFWEAYDGAYDGAYDRRWPKQDPHTGLQANGQVGYSVSLAHGWSSGPAAWLMEQVLGIQSTSAGFQRVTIRPDLLGLAWARGQVPTPHGPIHVEMRETQNELQITLPVGVTANLLVPVTSPGAIVAVNGAPVASLSAEEGTQAGVILNKPGEYKVVSK